MSGHPLRIWRTKHGLTQTALAAKVGLNGSSMISHIEAGRKSPSLEAAIKLSQETGIPVDRFVREGEAV